MFQVILIKFEADSREFSSWMTFQKYVNNILSKFQEGISIKFQEVFKDILRGIWESVKGVPKILMMFVGSSKIVLCVYRKFWMILNKIMHFQGNFNPTSWWMFQLYFNVFLRVFQKYFMDISKKCQVCFKDVCRQFQGVEKKTHRCFKGV